MKKCLIVLLVLFLLASLTGCKKVAKEESQVKRVAVLAKDETDEGKVIFLDIDNKEIKTITIEYPNETFHDDNVVYYSAKDNEYKGIRYDNFKETKTFENVFGYVLALRDDVIITYSSTGVSVVSADKKVEEYVNLYLASYYVSLDKLYLIDYSNILYIYNVADMTLINKYRVINSEFLSLTQIGDTVYLVSDNGYSEVKEDGLGMTYVYPLDFEEIYNAAGNMLFVAEKNERGIYTVSFDDHKMVLDTVLDEMYYTDVIYDVFFKEYYDEGFYVVDFFDVVKGY